MLHRQKPGFRKEAGLLSLDCKLIADKVELTLN
jgi:hypothetical protein